MALCLSAACTGCIALRLMRGMNQTLCLGAACTGCIAVDNDFLAYKLGFASALPARGASGKLIALLLQLVLCLGAACTGCIGKSRQIAAHHFVAYAVSR